MAAAISLFAALLPAISAPTHAGPGNTGPGNTGEGIAAEGIAGEGLASQGLTGQSLMAPHRPGPTTRIKDITAVIGVHASQLIGYGLVVGLQATGDSLRNAPFTDQALRSMLDHMGVNVRGGTPRTRNIAAVIVTAELPAFAIVGSRLDVSVSSLGDAASLAGGTLLMTPLAGTDGLVYAMAQGPVAASGFAVSGEAERISQGVPTVARIANGALIEHGPPVRQGEPVPLGLELRNPDYRTVVRIADRINLYAAQAYGEPVAREVDPRMITLTKPERITTARFLSQIGDLSIATDTPARIVIDERSGTIVIGRNVQISTVAVTHGSLTVRVSESPEVSQPAPFSDGETVITPQTIVDIAQEDGQLEIIGGASLQTLVSGLNQIGLDPAGIIAILQAIKTAGALQAELVVQ